jgi:hypothetical protein
MNKLAVLLATLVTVVGCQQIDNQKISVKDPSGQIEVKFQVQEGKALYAVAFNEKEIIKDSPLGFAFTNMPAIGDNLEIVDYKRRYISDPWQMPWGEKLNVENEYNQLTIFLKENKDPYRSFQIIFRVYDDGLGFRYYFPEQPAMQEVLISEENTTFHLTEDALCWWIPGDWDIYEHLYHTTRFSEIDATAYQSHDNLAQTYIPVNAVNTPFTLRLEDGTHLSFHEADLTNYAGMTLKTDTNNFIMQSGLVGSERTPYKVKRTTPFKTPWRTIQITKDAAGLIESDLIVNLNEPNKLGDIEWFQPMKYVGIWWDMHLGTKTWDLSATQDMTSATYGHGPSSTSHGATTAYAKELIDFAAQNNIGGILVEGWNTGWEHWIGFEDREGVFDFVTPYPDYDLEEVVSYGKEKGVELIMHHETSAAPRTYEQQMDTAFRLMQKLGIHSVKTGYVGKIIPKGEYHHGQWMVNHYRKVIEKAALYEIAVDAHEPIKATGLRRTYPNAISREGLRGQEFNAWATDGGNPPEHLPIVAFTRMLAGPIDYTPGVFNIKLKPYKENNQVNTTLAHQLALYVVINSPIQMVPDLMENYKGHPAFQFIRDVGVNWKQTKVLNGEVGDFVTIAREERKSGNWFLGAITDENPRTLEISLDFLEPDISYEATLYLDGSDAHWDDNPVSYEIKNNTLTNQQQLTLQLAPGGGAAISFIKK